MLLGLSACTPRHLPPAPPPGTASALVVEESPAVVAPLEEPPAPIRELVKDGGFEGPAPGAWNENNWAQNEVSFVRDTNQPYRGRLSQRMQITRATSIADLQLVQKLEGLEAGGAVRVRLALRGRSNSRSLMAQVRRCGTPYTTYGVLTMPPTGNWQTFGFVSMIPAVIPADGIGVYVHLGDESPAWVDEVSVGLLPPLDARGSLSGNLLVNGSFEVGLARWTVYNRDFTALANTPLASENLGAPSGAVERAPDAPHGTHLLALTVRPYCCACLNSAYFPYRYGHPLTARGRIRARSGGGAVELSLGHGESPNVVWLGKRSVEVGAAWQTVELSCLPGPSAGGGAFLQVFSGAPGEYLIDDLRVEQLPAATSSVPVYGCAVIDAPPGKLFRSDERPRLRVLAAGLPPGAQRAGVLRVSDVWERTIARIPVSLQTDADGAGGVELDLPSDRFGGFRCALEIDGALQAEAIYSLAPALPPPDGSGRSFFGGHFQLDPYALDLAERCGMRWLRLHPPLNTKWIVAEPEQGKRRFHTIGVERALARGFSILGSLDTTPQWAATPGIDLPYEWWNSRVPRDWTQWQGYVQAALRAFPGIRHWEIWNEPDISFLQVPEGVDKAAAYTDILTHTQQAVDDLARSDPALANVELVGLPVAGLDSNFFRDVIAKGGAGKVDSLAFHFYYEDLDPSEKRPDFLEQLATLRAARNRRGGEPGVWHTEGGIWIRSGPTWLSLFRLPVSDGSTQLQGAHTLVRTAVALKALGLRRHFQYAALGNASLVYRTECSGLIDIDGSARPSAAAHAAMVWLLDDAEPLGLETVAVGAAKVRLARFQSRSRGAIHVLWSRVPVPLAQVPGLPAKRGTMRDLMGNPLTGAVTLTAAPIYLIEGDHP